MAYYLTTLLVYGGVDVIACLALSQQFGVAGVTNFAFIVFQAAGAFRLFTGIEPDAERMMRHFLSMDAA